MSAVLKPRDWPQTYSQEDWYRLLCEMGVRPMTSAKYAGAFADEIQPGRFSAGMADLRAFLPQFLHETQMLERMDENLTYNSPERLCQVWPLRFPTLASAIPYTAAPRKLANKVYADRMGNGNEASGDGYLFRGRGFGLTGRAAYRSLGDYWGQDLEINPDLLEQPHYACEAAVLWWERTIPDLDLSDQCKCRRLVQGQTLGLEHCQALADLAAKVLA